jgi:hypothetical protein
MAVFYVRGRSVQCTATRLGPSSAKMSESRRSNPVCFALPLFALVGSLAMPSRSLGTCGDYLMSQPQGTRLLTESPMNHEHPADEPQQRPCQGLECPQSPARAMPVFWPTLSWQRDVALKPAALCSSQSDWGSDFCDRLFPLHCSELAGRLFRPPRSV